MANVLNYGQRPTAPDLRGLPGRDAQAISMARYLRGMPTGAVGPRRTATPYLDAEMGTGGQGYAAPQQSMLASYRPPPQASSQGYSAPPAYSPPAPNFLANRLAETNDPTTLGTLRGYQQAPWMNGSMPNNLPANNFDTTGYEQGTQNARLMRASAPGSNLLANVGPAVRANSGNYVMSSGDPGINAGALVAQNPNAMYGFSPEHQAQLRQGNTAFAADLAKRQLAYQARQTAGPQRTTLPTDANAQLTSRQRVMQNAIARSEARQGRLANQNAGPNIMDQLWQTNPEMAMQMAHQQQQNALGWAALNQSGIQGQGELAVRGQEAQGRLAALNSDMASKQQEVGANLLTAAAAIRESNPELADQMEQHAMKTIGVPGQNVMAGIPGSPQGAKRTTAKQEETLATLKTARQKRDYMQNVMKLPPDEITRRLRQDYQGPGIADHLLGIFGGGMRGPPNSTTPEGPMMPAYGGGLLNSFGFRLPF